MEGFLNLIAGYFGAGFSLIWALYTAYMGEDSSILGTFPKCLVIFSHGMGGGPAPDLEVVSRHSKYNNVDGCFQK